MLPSPSLSIVVSLSCATRLRLSYSFSVILESGVVSLVAEGSWWRRESRLPLLFLMPRVSLQAVGGAVLLVGFLSCHPL